MNSLIANLSPYADEEETYAFEYDIKEEFTQHLNKVVNVKGKDLTWARLTGSKKFYLIEPLDIVKQLVPINTDFTYRMEKVGKMKYKVASSNHDGTEYYDIEITDGLSDEEIVRMELSDELLTEHY
tara:strand:- start:2810 stop:3187 length:378 start_codon:yes stop_codon:yes gene_type:complete